MHNGSARGDRRTFLKRAAALAAGGAMLAAGPKRSAPDNDEDKPWFQISLAQWSLHRALKEKRLDPLDFPTVARRDHDFDAVEYVNQFYMGNKADRDYPSHLRKRADDAGVTSVLIMCDDEGRLGDPDGAKRTKAIENHRLWLEWASVLGCHAVRVNADSSGSPDEQRRLAADGLARLTEFAAASNLSVIAENHGGLSSNGQWLASVIKAVNHPRCGTLPDFGNFKMFRKPDGTYDEYDRYQGVTELMPFAKGVSAKSYDFNERGEETIIDYRRMMQIVRDAGYRGRVGVEYEGERLSEPDGIGATRALLERVRDELKPGAAATQRGS